MDVIDFLNKNADEWEIYYERDSSKSVKIEGGRIKLLESCVDSRYALRVIVDGRVGFATSSHLNLDVCRYAIRIAKNSEERLKYFPSGDYGSVEGIYDARIENATSEFLLKSAEDMINSAKDVKEVNPSNGYISLSCSRTRILNSQGVDLEYKETSCSAFLETVYRNSSGFEICESRTIDVDFGGIGRRAAELAVESVDTKGIESGIYDVVLSPIAVHQILSHTLYPSVCAENVLKRRSQLVEIGRKYIGEVTIIDDGTIPYALCSVPFDDEGIRTRKTVIFREGVLNSYITDFRNSFEIGIEPTGNGIRGNDMYPRTSPTNVILEFKDSDKDILENCLYVHAFIGAHTSNPVSGDFSLECMNAFLFKKGEKIPVKAMIYGNVYELLRNVEVFGRDVRQIENTISPSIRFKGIRVIQA